MPTTLLTREGTRRSAGSTGRGLGDTRKEGGREGTSLEPKRELVPEEGEITKLTTVQTARSQTNFQILVRSVKREREGDHTEPETKL